MRNSSGYTVTTCSTVSSRGLATGLFWILVTPALVWSQVSSQPSRGAPHDDLSCVKEMTIPTFTYLARRANQGGTVRAVVTVASSGAAGKIETFASSKDLAEEVRAFLSEEATFAKTCGGTLIEMFFTFRLEGEAEPSPQVKVRFQPPNHFTIISRPRAAVAN